MSITSQELGNKLDACIQIYNEKTKSTHFILAGSATPIAIMGPTGTGKASAFTETPTISSFIEFKNEAEALEEIIRICDARIHYNHSLMVVCGNDLISLSDKIALILSCLNVTSLPTEPEKALILFTMGIKNDEKRYRNIKEIIMTCANQDYLLDHIFDLIQVGYTTEVTHFKNALKKVQKRNESTVHHVERRKANPSFEANHYAEMLDILKPFTTQSGEEFSKFAIGILSQVSFITTDFSNFVVDFKRKAEIDLEQVTLLSKKLIGHQCDTLVDLNAKIIGRSEQEFSLAFQLLKKGVGIKSNEELATIFILNMRSIYVKLNDACINLKLLKKDIERKICIEAEQAAKAKMRTLSKVESLIQTDKDVKQKTEAVNFTASTETAAAMPSSVITPSAVNTKRDPASTISATATGNTENKMHALKVENRKKFQTIVQKYAVKELATATENTQTLQVELKQLLVLYYNLNSSQKTVLSNLLQKKSKNNSNAVTLFDFINLVEGSKNPNGIGYRGGLQGKVIHKGGSHFTVRIPNTYQKWEKSKDSILGYLEMPTASDGNFVPHGGSHAIKDLPETSRYLCCRALERAGITLERLTLAGIKMDMNVRPAKK